MRKYEGSITHEMKKIVNKDNIATGEGYPVNSFRKLVEISAKLAYRNKDSLLFYRGQKTDVKNKNEKSTFYPSIYRGNYISKREIEHKFEILQKSSKRLIEAVYKKKIAGRSELKRKRYIQWSILQHYEVCDTPLLDLTQSLRVACSFAQHQNDTDKAYVYVFGLPYITNRISINSEHDLVNIRLLSICPPEALRPYFQEGYLAATSDIEADYASKSELDFNRRLIAKFKIQNNDSFWGKEFNHIPEDALYPKNDLFKDICDTIKTDAKKEFKSGLVGDFLLQWNKLEPLASSNTFIFNKSYKNNDLDIYKNLQKLKKFRNELIHQPEHPNGKRILLHLELLEKVKSSLVGYNTQ